MVIIECLSFDGVVCLVIASTAEQVKVPLAGKVRCEHGLSLILNSIAHKEFLFVPGNEQSLRDLDRGRTERTAAPNGAVTCQRDGDALFVLADRGFVWLLAKVTYLIIAGLCIVFQGKAGGQEMVDQAVAAMTVRDQVLLQALFPDANGGMWRPRR